MREREKERKREGKKEREREGGGGGGKKRIYTYICIYLHIIEKTTKKKAIETYHSNEEKKTHRLHAWNYEGTFSI